MKTLPFSKTPVPTPRRRPITRPQTIATLRRIIRTLRAKNTDLAERLLIDLGMNLTA
jgi:hypothetical protein